MWLDQGTLTNHLRKWQHYNFIIPNNTFKIRKVLKKSSIYHTRCTQTVKWTGFINWINVTWPRQRVSKLTKGWHSKCQHWNLFQSPIYIINSTDTAPQFFRNLPPLFICEINWTAVLFKALSFNTLILVTLFLTLFSIHFLWYWHKGNWFHPFTPEISLVILPNACDTILMMFLLWTWYLINYWLIIFFILTSSLLDKLYWHCKERFCSGHSWEWKDWLKEKKKCRVWQSFSLLDSRCSCELIIWCWLL